MRTCSRQAALCCKSCVTPTLVQWPCTACSRVFRQTSFYLATLARLPPCNGCTGPKRVLHAMCTSRVGMATHRLHAFALVRRHEGSDTCAPMKSHSCASLCFAPTSCRWRSFCARDACTLSAGSPGHVCHDKHFMHCTRVRDASTPCQTSARLEAPQLVEHPAHGRTWKLSFSRDSASSDAYSACTATNLLSSGISRSAYGMPIV